MKVWALAVLICARASAAVVETAPEAASGASGQASLGAAAVPAVPAASILAPSLSLSAALAPAALGAKLGLAPGAGQMRLAPPATAASPTAAATSASASPVSAAPSPTATSVLAAAGTANPVSSVPPPASASATPGTAAAAAAVGNDSAAAGVKTETGRLVAPAPRLPDARASAEEDASASRAFWDQAASRPRLDASVLAASAARGVPAFVPRMGAVSGPIPAAIASAASDGELRDAVGAAFPAAAATFGVSASGRPSLFGAAPPVAAPASAPASPAGPALSAPRLLERLTLSLGSDLAVRVRSVANRFVAGARLLTGRGAGARSSSVLARPGSAPLTSTRWLERRGMLETAAIPGAEASVVARGPSVSTHANGLRPASTLFAMTAAGSRPVSVRAVPLRAGSGAPLALWALAFLPATLALLRDSLR